MKTKNYYFISKYYLRRPSKEYGPYKAERVEKAWAMFVRDRFSLFGSEPLWKEMKDEWSYYCV